MCLVGKHSATVRPQPLAVVLDCRFPPRLLLSGLRCRSFPEGLQWMSNTKPMASVPFSFLALLLAVRLLKMLMLLNFINHWFSARITFWVVGRAGEGAYCWHVVGRGQRPTMHRETSTTETRWAPDVSRAEVGASQGDCALLMLFPCTKLLLLFPFWAVFPPFPSPCSC